MSETQELTQTHPIDNGDLETMDRQQLRAELARLRRSQGGNPAEEKWRPELLPRLQRIEILLNSPANPDNQNKDLEQMSAQELRAEIDRLGKSQAGNPSVEPWKLAMHDRLLRAIKLEKIAVLSEKK